MSDPTDASELIRRGQAAARIGAADEARTYLRRAVKLAPKRADAWLALAGVEDDAQEKLVCLETVLRLDPSNDEARLGLEMLRERLAAPQPAGQQAPDELETVIAEASRRLEQAVGPAPVEQTPPDDERVFCANHPNVETLLRCNRCGKPICNRCATLTPVGYRCRECVGRQQAVFYTGGNADYVIGAMIALILGGIADVLMSMLRAWFFGLILGPAAGIGIAEAVRWAVRRRRSRYLWLAVAGGIVAGALPALLLGLLSVNLWSLATTGLFLFLAVGAAAARLR